MSGSPTLLIDGIDPFASAIKALVAVSCRLYRDETGRIVPVPSVDQLRAAFAEANQSVPDRFAEAPAEVLSAWRSRACPMDPAGRAVHQEILRAFAATGPPPAAATSTGRRRCGLRSVLAALHEVGRDPLGP